MTTYRPIEASPDDRLAIEDTLLRYSTAIDTKDWRLFETCFTPDTTARYGPELTWSGVTDLTATFEKAHSMLDASMHRVLNVVLLTFDGDSATTRSYADAILIQDGAPGGDTCQVTGVYLDELVRTSAGWQIADREFRAVQTIGNPGVLAMDPDAVRRSFAR